MGKCIPIVCATLLASCIGPLAKDQQEDKNTRGGAPAIAPEPAPHDLPPPPADLAPPPMEATPVPEPPTALSFTDIDFNIGEVGGIITITPSAGVNNIIGYSLYWGYDSSSIIEPSFASISPESLTYELSPNIPLGGSHMLAVAIDQLGQSSTPAAIAVADWQLAPTVAPLFPTNGANWNDYILKASEDTLLLEAEDTACTAEEAASCIHGGIHRVIDLQGLTNCDNLTIDESLNFFSWQCHAESDRVRIVSHALNDGVSLRNLLNDSTWRDRCETGFDYG